MAAKRQPGSDIVVTTTVELIGVGLLALLAEIKPLGNIVVIVMVGFVIGWLLINTPKLQGWLKKA
jgi:hypothetical protein